MAAATMVAAYADKAKSGPSTVAAKRMLTEVLKVRITKAPPGVEVGAWLEEVNRELTLALMRYASGFWLVP